MEMENTGIENIGIEKTIREAAPEFQAEHAMEALEHTGVYLFRYFPKLKMLVMTERVCQDFQVRPVYENMPDSFAEDFVAPEDREQFKKLCRRIEAGTPESSVDFRGRERLTWCHVTLTTVEWDEEHRPELCVGVIENRSKEEIVKEELNSILTAVSCGILQYRETDNELIRANKAALEILGYDTVEALNEDRENGVVRTVLPEDRGYIKELVNSLRHPGEIKTIEYRVQHKGSDQIRHCYGTVQIYEDIHGERIVLRSIMDITDRKLKEDIQHTNDDLVQRLNTIMSGISGGFEIRLDNSGFTYMFLSDSVAALQGYTVEELSEVCHGSALENIHPDDRAYVAEHLKDITLDSEAYNIKYRLFHKDGSLVWVMETGKKIQDSDGQHLYYCLIQDITESQKRAEELNHLLTMQRQMMSSLSCGVLAYTLPERELLIANKELKRIFRYGKNTKKTLIQTLFDYVLPEDRTEISKATKRLQNVGDSCKYLLHPLQEDGTRLTVECITKLRAFDDGKQFILSVTSDITKLEERNKELNSMNTRQKRMLTGIRRERQQYRNALVSGSEYSYQFDVTDGMLLSDFDYSVRGSLEENLGINAPISFDVMMERWLEVMKPEFLTPEEQNPLTAEEVKACYERGNKHIVTEYFNERENKYFRRTFLLSEDEETGHIWAIAIVNDITNIMREETRKRQELSAMNRSLRNQIGISKAFSSIYFASWEVNLETGRLNGISVPDWAEPIQEHTYDRENGDFEAAVQEMIDTYVKEEYREQMGQFVCLGDMGERLKEESILTFEYQGVHYGWSTACLIPSIRDEEGNVQRVIFALREISKEKRLELEAKQALEEAYEAANRANAAKTEFLSSVSHDIRTPMNGIIGMTAIAGTHLDDKERVADCLSKISVASKHLLGLINEVLDMNKIESGKLDLNVEEFSLSDLIDALLIMAKPQIESKKHKLSIQVQGVEHERVIGDSLRLQQVFVNLLSNAIKYTPEGGKISLSLSEKATNRPKIGCFEFIVEDNGIGMSEEYQKKLFEPFSRAKDQRVAKIQGSGLGMPIARNIVRMMNGDIQVESELSKGTKFIVTLYLELQDKDETLTAEEFLDLPILVADDEETACVSTCGILEELGMKGEWVLTGEEAVEKTVARHEEKNDYFAVILDWKMPGMDGVMTAREIRKKVGEDLPIIIISAYDWSDIEQEARAAGVSAFISKPIFKSRIAYLFKNLLGQEPEQTNHSAIQELAEKKFEGRRALLAEDNELNAEIVEELLGMTGFVIDHAANGKEAVDFVAEHPQGYYDVILMDVQMPVMNGYEATRAIRSLPGAYEKRVPIIAMTANAFAEDVQSAKNAGMNEHIAKPLNITQLIKALERWLK